MAEPNTESCSEDVKVKVESKDDHEMKVKVESKDDHEMKAKVEPKDDHETNTDVVSESVKTEHIQTNDFVKVKKENGCVEDTDGKLEIKTETGHGTGIKKEETPTAEELNDPKLEAQIVRQVEYYFGDINLPRDKFLQEQIKLDDGWIPIDVMLRFQRLSGLSKKPETITTCLKSSSKLIEVHKDGTKIRRSPSQPLPDLTPEYLKAMDERTVYVKGFPVTLNDLNKLMDFFAPYGPLKNLHMRRYTDSKTKVRGIFKGSVYALFETKELADKFLALESVLYDGKELSRMTKTAHVEEQKREKDERWGKKVKKGKSEDTKGSNKQNLLKGCILKISSIKNQCLGREEVKAALVALGANVAYVQFDKGDPEAVVRLYSTEDGAAAKFIKSLEESGKKVTFNEEEVELNLLEGEEEDTFLSKMRLAFENKSNPSKRSWNRGGQGNFRGKHRGNKRAGSPNRDEAPAAKKEAPSAD